MRLLLLILCLFYMGCSDTAGGTGTETTNGIVTLSDGAPAAGAVVYLRRPSLWYSSVSSSENTVVDSALCDSRGFYDFSSLYESPFSLEVIHGDEGRVVHGHSDTLQLSPYCSFAGSVPAGVEKVYLGGSDLSSFVSGGLFSFTEVPAGYYPLFTGKDGVLSLSSSIVVSQAMSEVVLPTVPGLLFDDFTAAFEQSPLNYLSTGVYWYTFSDFVSHRYDNGEWILKQSSPHEGNSTVAPSASKGVMSLQVTLGDQWDYPFGGIGAALVQENRGFNLSAMDSLHLRAKGSGVVRINLESNLLDSSSLSQYGVLCTLATEWKEWHIPVSDLHLRVRDSLFEKAQPWSSVAPQIDRLEATFQSLENSVNVPLHLELDYVIWGGVSTELL